MGYAEYTVNACPQGGGLEGERLRVCVSLPEEGVRGMPIALFTPARGGEGGGGATNALDYCFIFFLKSSCFLGLHHLSVGLPSLPISLLTWLSILRYNLPYSWISFPPFFSTSLPLSLLLSLSPSLSTLQVKDPGLGTMRVVIATDEYLQVTIYEHNPHRTL